MRQCDGSLRGALRGVLSAIAMTTAIARSKRSGFVRATLLLVDSFTPGLQAPVYTRLALSLRVSFSPPPPIWQALIATPATSLR